MKTKDAYTELAIQIATLDMKLDAVLKLLNRPEIKLEPLKFDIRNCDEITPDCVSGKSCKCVDKFSQAMKEATTITLSNQEWDELNK